MFFFLLTFQRYIDIIKFEISYGPVAQLGERCVRIAEAEGSTPFRSTSTVPVPPNHGGTRFTRSLCPMPSVSFRLRQFFQTHSVLYYSACAPCSRRIRLFLYHKKDSVYQLSLCRALYSTILFHFSFHFFHGTPAQYIHSACETAA